MKPRKLTKRQILNALLAADETSAKISASQQRVWARRKKLEKTQEDLSKQLDKILYAERKKAGDENAEQPPIVFKQHVFEVSDDVLYGTRRYECEITKVNNVS